MSSPDTLLAALGFSKKHQVHGRTSVADLFPERGRCGIYVLHMADNTCYVGLSTDVTKRYQQHRLTYPDIVALSFKRVGKSIGLLREAERDVIHRLDSHSIPLLNKVHNSISYHSSPLDLIIPPEEQRRWLETGTYTVGAHIPGPAAVPPEKLARDRRKVEEFRRLPNCREIAVALRKYIVNTIPAYTHTQGKYWSMSCLPSTSGGWRAATINMSTMETFVIAKDENCNFINVSSKILEYYYAERDFMAKYPYVEYTTTAYEAAGFDQLSITTYTFNSMMSILSDPLIQKSTRLMNLRLMRQRGSFFSNFHSPGLTDLILATGDGQI